MGNSTSSNQHHHQHHQHQHQGRTSNKHHHPAAPKLRHPAPLQPHPNPLRPLHPRSNPNPNSHLNPNPNPHSRSADLLNRKRKSLELPDLDPNHQQNQQTPTDPNQQHQHHHHQHQHIQSISNSTHHQHQQQPHSPSHSPSHSLTNTLTNTLINPFQLRLPSNSTSSSTRSRSNSTSTSRPSRPASPLVTHSHSHTHTHTHTHTHSYTHTLSNQITPALDHLSFDHLNPPLSPSPSPSPSPVNLLTNPPPNQSHPDRKISSSNSHHQNQTHSQPQSHSPIISSAPLQQPIETVLPPLPPSIFQPFPLPSLDADCPQLPPVPLTPAVTESVKAATAVVQASPALDIGAGPAGVPTLITWKEPAHEVFVTGTFSKWKQQIKLRKPQLHDQTNQQNAFSALVALPPGPHQLKFIVDGRWKTSKYLPSATDNKGNLINYLQVNPGDQPFRGLGPRGIWSGYTYGIGYSIGSMLEDSHQNDYLNQEGGHTHHSDSEEDWTSDIPNGLLEYEEYHDRSDSEEIDQEHPSHTSSEPTKNTTSSHKSSSTDPSNAPVPGQAGFAAEPPKLPAQLREGILNLSSRSPQLASDDNSLLPRPDHSVLNHLAASPIRHGLLSVGVTSRFKRKYLTTVYYKPVDL